MITELTRDNLEEARGADVAVVDCWSPGCRPCRVLTPLFERLAEREEVREAKFYTLNTAAEKRLALELGVRGTPAFLVWKKGKETARLVGDMANISDVRKRLLQVMGRNQ